MKKIPLLFVTVDALGKELISKSHTPFIDEIFENGMHVVDSNSCFPTLTTPMMTSILTGNYPIRHGIPSNYRYLEDIKETRGKLRNIKCTTIADILKEKDYKSLSVQHFMLENHADKYIQLDDGNDSSLLTKTIIKELDYENYDAVFAIYQAVDGFGHRYGAFSKKTIVELEKIDREIEALYRYLKIKWGDFLFVLSSDHSMSTAEKFTNAKIENIFKELGLKAKVYSSGDKIDSDVDCALLKFPTVPVFLISEKAKKCESDLIEKLQEVKYMEKVYTKKDMKQLGNPDYADVAFCLKKGYSTEKSVLVHKYGYHGTLNEKPNVINYYGYNVKKSKIAYSDLVDIVPTTLDILKINTETKFDGKNRNT